MKLAEFKQLIQTVADGWNEGNARQAADCFKEIDDSTAASKSTKES